MKEAVGREYKREGVKEGENKIEKEGGGEARRRERGEVGRVREREREGK